MNIKRYENLSLDELFKLVDDIRKKGYLFFIKIDGEREENHITIIISDPKNLSKEQIRFDGQHLDKVMIKAISKFFSIN